MYKVMKTIFSILLIACCTFGTANAQLGKLKSLGKKVENATKKEVEKTSEAVQTATAIQQTSSLESYEKRQNDGTIVFTGENLGMYAKACKTDWKEVQTHVYDPNEWIAGTKVVEQNALYYLYKWMKAAEEGDTEKLTGEVYTRLGWCVGQVVSYHKNEKYGIQLIDMKQFVKDYNAATKVFKNLLWTGMPQNNILPKNRKTQEDFDNYAKNTLASWVWCIDKAEEAKAAGKKITQQFYLNQVVGLRELALCAGYLKGDEAGFANMDSRLAAALKETPSKFQADNKMRTPAECLALQKSREEQWAKEDAEKEAARLAEIEKNTQDWPKSNMPDLDAQILAIMKQKFPDQKVFRVSVMNNKWNVMMKGLVPERRVVQFWAEFENKKGMRYAEEHYVCQYYNGNSYGKTEYQSRGTRFFYVRQK